MQEISLQSFKRLKKKIIQRMAALETSGIQYSRSILFRKRQRALVKKLQSKRALARTLMKNWKGPIKPSLSPLLPYSKINKI